MNVSKRMIAVASAAVVSLIASHRAAAQYAANVVSFDSGATATPGYATPLNALGTPARITGTGQFDGIVSPFNPPYQTTDLVSIGEGGHLTLRLSHYAIPQAAGPEIGVFSNFGLIDIDYPNGQAGNPAGGFGLPDNALVEVSENGAAWVSLGYTAFDIPANGYTDLTDPFFPTAGSVPSDFQQPFTGNLASFDGLKYFDAGGPDMLDLLNGSGGGKWLDISGTGLAQVGFIRFSLANDADSDTNFNFELDGVSVSHAAMGSVVVPEPATLLLVSAIAFNLVGDRRFRARKDRHDRR